MEDATQETIEQLTIKSHIDYSAIHDDIPGYWVHVTLWLPVDHDGTLHRLLRHETATALGMSLNAAWGAEVDWDRPNHHSRMGVLSLKCQGWNSAKAMGEDYLHNTKRVLGAIAKGNRKMTQSAPNVEHHTAIV
ncbi:MAG: hypothetical protein MH825_08120 [Cyanobacteria bacterium]|nr:hypothetical protein [Cyanobacteriota bacterium]